MVWSRAASPECHGHGAPTGLPAMAKQFVTVGNSVEERGVVLESIMNHSSESLPDIAGANIKSDLFSIDHVLASVSRESHGLGPRKEGVVR